MYCKIVSGAVSGVQAYAVGVEVDIDRGLPSFSMVGLLGSEVRESRERVSVALKNSGFALPVARIMVNLSPADKRKDGTAFDLPIAVGILQAMEYFPEHAADGILFLGELGLNGEVKRVRGVLPIVQEAAGRGIHTCIVPAENVGEGAVVPGIRVWGAERIEQVLTFLQAAEEERLSLLKECCYEDVMKWETESNLGKTEQRNLPESGLEKWDFAQVEGQESARRAAEIAAAGFHNLLMVGPPGAGKSMIAKRIPGILPPLTRDESLEVTAIYSVAGLLKEGQSLVRERPYQSPHHTVSQAAMTGGNLRPRPGLITLSHRGILFLDELPEFQREVIDSLRQPIEEHQVQIARAGGNLIYPAEFMLVCAMNPCPCGFYPDRNRCKCTESQRMRYVGRVSGPIWDRIDLQVELQAVDITCLGRGKPSESSADIRMRVQRARRIQEERFRGTNYRFNADMEAGDMERYCHLGEEERKTMEQLYHNLQLSARAYHRICRVARTIADLAGEEEIRKEHLLEAAGFRGGCLG